MKWVARILGGLLALTLVGAGIFWWIALPDRPGEFYEFAGDVPQAPGKLLRLEELNATLPAGSRGYRILYSTTRPDGSAAVASAVVVVPNAAGAPLPVVAYAHGTTGVRRGCAPSSFEDPFPNVPGFPELLAEGWAYVATDYVGLGTDGGHLYLVGEDAARAVLDSIRVLRQVDGLTLASETVIWGHSQGGHSALWAGQKAQAYAPELRISGIAAVSPASDLPRLVDSARGSTFGKIISAYLIDAYGRAYADVESRFYLGGMANWIARDIAKRCIESPDILLSVAETMLLPSDGLFANPPNEGAFGRRLAENVPTGPFAAPVFIAQGMSDDLVLPAIQDDFVKQLCLAGMPVEYRQYEGRDHVSVVEADSPLTADLVSWSRSRFQGDDSIKNCNR